VNISIARSCACTSVLIDMSGVMDPQPQFPVTYYHFKGSFSQSISTTGTESTKEVAARYRKHYFGGITGVHNVTTLSLSVGASEK